jgi:hypothetical protein
VNGREIRGGVNGYIDGVQCHKIELVQRVVVAGYHMNINIGFIAVDHVVKRMALVLIQTDGSGIHGDVIGNQGVEGYAP